MLGNDESSDGEMKMKKRQMKVIRSLFLGVALALLLKGRISKLFVFRR
jgi:hypothetical protein